MAKWKRKKYDGQGTSPTLEGEEMSPLGTCLLEHFANGMSAPCWHLICFHHMHTYASHPPQACMCLEAEGPSIQALAMAALKSGQNSPDIQELASLGNFGKNPNHVANQLQKKYCQNSDIDIPFPFSLDCPVLLKGSDGICHGTRKVGMFLPHEWFHWLCGKEGVSGLNDLSSFWADHSIHDPQLKHSPVMDPWIGWMLAECFGAWPTRSCPFLSLHHLRIQARNSSPWDAMVMVVPFKGMTASMSSPSGVS